MVTFDRKLDVISFDENPAGRAAVGQRLLNVFDVFYRRSVDAENNVSPRADGPHPQGIGNNRRNSDPGRRGCRLDNDAESRVVKRFGLAGYYDVVREVWANCLRG